MTPLVMLLIWLGATFTATTLTPDDCREVLKTEATALTADGWEITDVSEADNGDLRVVYRQGDAPHVMVTLFVTTDTPEPEGAAAKIYTPISSRCNVYEEDGEPVRFEMRAYRGVVPIRKHPNTDFKA